MRAEGVDQGVEDAVDRLIAEEVRLVRFRGEPLRNPRDGEGVLELRTKIAEAIFVARAKARAEALPALPPRPELPEMPELSELREVIRHAGLIGVTDAAEILEVNKPRIYKLTEQGRMPAPVIELKNGPIYLRAEVEALAAKLNGERAERAAKAVERAEKAGV